MRVGVVTEQLRRGVPGGIGRYVEGLLAGLRQLGGAGPDVDRVDGAPLPTALATRLWDAGVLKAPRHVDLLHAPALAFPATGGPLVVVVHDLAWRDVPHAFPPRGKRWHEAALARARRLGAVLLAPTDDLADALRSDASTGRVVTLDGPLYGCDHLPTPDAPGAAERLRALGVVGSYLLAVGTLEPRKNLARLLRSYSQARADLPEPWPLVVVGAIGWGEQVEPVDGVVQTGPVDDRVLAGLYAGARCVAYVPLLEGFGFPAVEAMAIGVPVVATPMPSTAGAAYEVDPVDVESMADALVRVATNDEVRRDLLARGRARAAELTWRDAAARHVDLWKTLA